MNVYVYIYTYTFASLHMYMHILALLETYTRNQCRFTNITWSMQREVAAKASFFFLLVVCVYATL